MHIRTPIYSWREPPKIQPKHVASSVPRRKDLARKSWTAPPWLRLVVIFLLSSGLWGLIFFGLSLIR